MKISVVWSMQGTVEIDKPTMKESLDYFKTHMSEIPLPKDGTYLEGSFSLFTEDPEEMKSICTPFQNQEFQSTSERNEETEQASNTIKMNVISECKKEERAESLTAKTGNLSQTIPLKEGRKKFLVLDGSSMLSTAYYAFLPNEIKFAKEESEKEKYFDKILHAPDGTYTNAIYGMMIQLKKILDGWNPDYLAVCFDKTRETFRRELYPPYKAQRKPTQKPLKQQFLLMEQLLSSARIPVFLSNTYEADDLAGSLTKKYREKYHIRLLSKDRDYLQLISDAHDVRLWIPATEKEQEEYQKMTALYSGKEDMPPEFLKHLVEYTEGTVIAMKGVTPNLIPDLKSIEGDISDNIPGVKGVSSAAAPLLMEYGSLEGVYDAIDSCNGDVKKEKALSSFWKDTLGIKRSPLNAMKTDRDIAYLSKRLATIRTDCLDRFPFTLENHPLKNADFDLLNKKMSELGIKTIKF